MAGIFTAVKKGARNSALIALQEYNPLPLVIFSHSNGSEPSTNYVVISILSITQQGHANVSTLTNVDEELSISAVYEALVQFSFVGSDSGDMAHSFSQRMGNNPSVLQELSKNKMAFMRKSQIRRAPQKRETQWVEYQNMDVTFNYIVNSQQLVDVIDHIIVQDSITGNEEVIPPYTTQ